MKEERYIKKVEWEKDNFGFFSNWIMLIFITLFFPILYIQERRRVYYIKEKVK